MRRLVARRINHNPRCRKMAWQDIRRRGENSRFIKVGDRIRFRES